MSLIPSAISGQCFFRLAKAIYLLASLLIISGCSSSIHEDFLANLVNDRVNNDGSFENHVVSLVYDDKGKYLAVGHESGNVDIWDATEPRSIRRIKAHEYRAGWITFTHDGSGFFSNSYFEESTKLWSAKTGELLYSIPDTRGPVSSTSDSRIYLIGQSAQIRIFDFKRKLLLPEKYHSSGVILTMTVDAASRLVAVGTASGSIEIWRIPENSGTPVLQNIANAKPYATGDWVVGLQFSPDGEKLYSVARSGLVDEWSLPFLERGRAISTALKHIHSVAFFKEKGLLALGGTEDGAGIKGGAVELISLTAGTSTIHRSNTNLPVVAFLPPLGVLLSSQSSSIEAYNDYSIDMEGASPSWSTLNNEKLGKFLPRAARGLSNEPQSFVPAELSR